MLLADAFPDEAFGSGLSALGFRSTEEYSIEGIYLGKRHLYLHVAPTLHNLPLCTHVNGKGWKEALGIK